MEEKFLVGTSGWQYGHWKAVFYPKELPYNKWLKYYNNFFNTTELNVTFYRDVKSSSFEKWYNTTSTDFKFSIKLNRLITHLKRLKVDAEIVNNFLIKMAILKEKLGIILIQLPPSLKFDISLLKDFLSCLNKSYRYAMEVRNNTFINDNFFELLRKSGIAFVLADSAGRYPYFEAITANFIYIRLHGSKRLYTSSYNDGELKKWAQKIILWDKKSYIYFDNDFSGYAVKNALKLKNFLTQ